MLSHCTQTLCTQTLRPKRVGARGSAGWNFTPTGISVPEYLQAEFLHQPVYQIFTKLTQERVAKCGNLEFHKFHPKRVAPIETRVCLTFEYPIGGCTCWLPGLKRMGSKGRHILTHSDRRIDTHPHTPPTPHPHPPPPPPPTPPPKKKKKMYVFVSSTRGRISNTYYIVPFHWWQMLEKIYIYIPCFQIPY